MNSSVAFAIEMKARTKQFSLRVIKLFQSLPKTEEAKILGRQLLRSATSVGANYRAACRARSDNEYYAKMSIVVEEADESMYWLELIDESSIFKSERVLLLLNEAEEITKIFAASRRKLKLEK
jgi:four helix bundle protein